MSTKPMAEFRHLKAISACLGNYGVKTRAHRLAIVGSLVARPGLRSTKDLTKAEALSVLRHFDSLDEAGEMNLLIANATLDEIADEQDSAPAARHGHQFELDPKTGEYRACKCGQPWIRDLVDDGELVEPDIEPWDAMFDRIRTEAAEAGWKA